MPDNRTGGSFPNPDGTTSLIMPIPERSYAPVFPYRGTEQHGVPVEDQPWIPQDADAQSWEGEVAYDPEVEPIQPVPVIIVERSEREIRSWRSVVQGVRLNLSTLIVGQNDRMSRVRIRNLVSVDDTDMVIWIGHNANVGPLAGWPVYPQEIVELSTEEEVYAVLDPNASSATNADVAIIIEHSVG